MTPYTNTLLTVVTTDGPLAGHWFQVPKDTREHKSVVFNKTAGTGTFKIEGRDTPTEDTGS